MTPSESNGCGTLSSLETTAGRPDITALPFDNTADENAQFSISFPKSWDESTIQVTAYWSTADASTSNDVAWAVAGIAFPDGSDASGDIDTAFPAPTALDKDTSGGAEFLNITNAKDITVSGSPAAGELCFFEVSRDISDTAGTTLGADALLIGLKIFYTTNAATDA